VIRRFDREQHNVRAAVEWGLRTGDTATGLRAVAPIWRWFQQRGVLREARELLARLLAAPPADLQLHIDALAAVGGLAYWADDFDVAGRAYDERVLLADRIGDPTQRAEAHYDLGFISMVRSDAEGLREHEATAFELFTQAGNKAGILKSRQALGLGVFLTGDYTGALELEAQNLAEFRAMGAEYLIADSMTFHAGAYFKQGKPGRSWEFVREGLRWFADNDNQSGIARALGMAAIVALAAGDDALAELGARATGATYRVADEKGVMIAPVKVLHLPDPRELATTRLGEARADELIRDGRAAPVEQVIAEVLASPGPA
jgi:tetratricopeptide (TPR) repeat protein